MFPRLEKGRKTLHKSKFQIRPNGDWYLLLPNLYSQLFEVEEPLIMHKSSSGWHQGDNANEKYIYFGNLKDSEVIQVNEFIEIYKKLVILGLNKYIESKFSDELDFCIALDYPAKNLSERASGRGIIGELVHLAKYKQRLDKANELVAFLVKAILRMLKGKSYSQFSLSYVPKEDRAKFYLPKYLAERIVSEEQMLEHIDESCPLIDSRLIVEKEKLKNLLVADKYEAWEKMYNSNKVQVSDKVDNRNIIIIDDLYQSGTTMWSYAKFLKDNGASRVLGIACEKNFRDSDNR